MLVIFESEFELEDETTDEVLFLRIIWPIAFLYCLVRFGLGQAEFNRSKMPAKSKANICGTITTVGLVWGFIGMWFKNDILMALGFCIFALFVVFTGLFCRGIDGN